MALDNQDIKNIAHLARIDVTEQDISAVRDKLSSVFDMIEQLQAAPTDDIEPMAHPMDATQRLREDVVTEQNQRDAYQSIAPATEDGLYLVPKVIE